LEKFQSTSEEIQKRKFPPTPKLILAGNSFIDDETFKQFVAFQVDHGVSYFVAQHGNNYGTLLYTNPSIEEETSDHFISWGWKSENVIPGFIIKNPKPKLRKSSRKKEDLLLIIGHKNFSTYIHNTENELMENVTDQRNFLKLLNVEICERTIVRFHPYSLRNGENGLINDIGNLAVNHVNFGDSNIRPLIKRSRVVVHAYDSTGILETLSQNIPTMAFWHKESSPKVKSAEMYYRILEEVGIIHYNSESAANFLNSNFEKIDEWWLSDKVQYARQYFCNEYARTNNNPVGTLTRILKSS
jgi:putative transferase (TIGR04331 family)